MMATEATDRSRANQTTETSSDTTNRSRSTKRAGTTGESNMFGGSTGALIGAAAAGVAVGLMANLGRKVAVQAPTKLAGEWDQALKAEHAATLKLFDTLQSTTEKNTTKRSMLLMQIKHALAKHSLQEENAIYPALRDGGQKDQADHLNHDHGYVKQYLYDLENMPKESPAFLTKVAEFRADLERHMTEEENQIFPTLKAKLSPEKNKALTALMNKEGFKLA